MNFSKSVRQNSLKTFLIHYLLTFILCIYYQGIFLFIYPPLMISWILMCVLFSITHIYIHRKVTKHFLKDDLIAQIWLNPLLFLTGFLILTLGGFGFFNLMGQAGLVRQTTQLSLELFSKFIYIYFLMIFSSGTYLFVELFINWSPKLQPLHFSDKSRSMARRAYAVMGICLLGGLFYVSNYRQNNIVYIGAVITSNLNGESQRAIELFESIPKYENSLYVNSRYRIARIYQNHFRQYDKAIEYFSQVVQQSNSSLRDDAIYQTLVCMFLDKADAIEMDQYFGKHTINDSCLKDECLFLIARKWESIGNLERASEIYHKLTESNVYSFTLLMFQNSRRRDFRLTRELAEELLLEINTRSL